MTLKLIAPVLTKTSKRYSICSDMNSLKGLKSYQTLGRWLLVLLCLGAIAYLSGQSFTEQDLRPKIRQQEQLVDWIRGLPEVEFTYSTRPLNNTRNPVDFAHFWIRKSAHVIVYSIFGLALLAALGDIRMRQWKRWMLVLALVFAIASLDEWNQMVAGDRAGMFRDVILDMVGFVVVSSLVKLTQLAAPRSGRNRLRSPG